jgi:hypothetical protein
MKKLKKIPLKRRRKKIEEPTPGRITNETVAEHRERILAGGRKFKYPHQYVRHKLVINAVLITLAVVVVAALVGWWQLYVAQNTSEFMYRVTRVLPLPVGAVDGETMRYSDYLMRYRSQELWLRNQGQLGLNGNDEQVQLNFYKRKVIDGLEADTYAQKIARELGLAVSSDEVQAAIDETRKTASGEISQTVYDASTQDTLGYSPDEYRHILRQSLLRQKVAYAVDKKATEAKNKVSALLKKEKDPSLEKVVDTLKKQGINVEFGASGMVPTNNQDGGLSETALELKDDEISQPIKSTTGDGYYFIQRLAKTDRQVSYQFIHVPLTVFEKQFNQVVNQNKVVEYIAIKKEE